MNDTIPVNPNTVRVKAKILSSTETHATLSILTVIGSGQGIINPLSERQEVTVQLRGTDKKIKSGKTITADLKEKLGVDNSQSSYVVVQFKE
jgi:ribosomal protein S24E